MKHLAIVVLLLNGVAAIHAMYEHVKMKFSGTAPETGYFNE